MRVRVFHGRYELTEFAEALDHAQDTGKNTKVLLRMSEVGVMND